MTRLILMGESGDDYNVLLCHFNGAIQHQYDKAGRLLAVIYSYDELSANGLGLVALTSYTYDSLSRRTQLTNSNK